MGMMPSDEGGWSIMVYDPGASNASKGGGGVMFWDGIINSTLVGPFFVKEGVKMNSKNYVDFLQANFMQWFNRE